MELVKEKFIFDITNIDSLLPLEKLPIRWCLENVLPLQVFKPMQYNQRIVRHEDLRNDINIFLDLCKEFNLVPINDINNEYKNLSSKTHPQSSIVDPQNIEIKSK